MNKIIEQFKEHDWADNEKNAKFIYTAFWASILIIVLHSLIYCGVIVF